MAVRCFVVCLCVLLGYGSVKAQDAVVDKCSKYKLYTAADSRITVISTEEDGYDVKYVKFDIALSNTDVYISGNVTTASEVTAPNFTTYVFELSNLLSIDSVIVNGQLCSYTHIYGLCKVVLPGVFLKGDQFIAKVYYHGTPKTGNGYFDRAGLNNNIVDDYGMKITYTLSEPYSSSDWWPCKQSLTDKIDSADIWITVPVGLKVGSNGILKKTTIIPGGNQRYEWHTNYPTDYYLFSAAVGPYADYSYIVPLDGTGDSVLVQNYIYNDPLAIEKFKPGLDSTAAMLQYFSEVFGVYPFYKEKYGHSLVPLFGGMEHQTMTTCGNSGPLLVSHELAHQWFGDHVTCASWKDIWLNEGFASYAEYLFLKKFRGDTVAEKRMLDFHKNLMNPNDSGGTVYVDDTTNINRIFDGRLSYSKAAAVIHTLRFVINSDELFFDILKKYQQKFAFRNANTNDFKELAEQIVNTDLSVFFDQWIYKQGYPVYSSEWNSINGESFVRLKQVTTHPASVALFITPVELKLLFENSDTIVRVETTLNEQLYKFRFGKPITGVIVDPNNKLLNADR